MKRGALVILAYPEEMVSMIPAWYRKPLEWIGMVRNGKICAGHAAMLLIDTAHSEFHYADFGRYVTPFGLGRTRYKDTDPEVEMKFQINTNNIGVITNKEELLQYIYSVPEKTHGGDVMYAAFNEEIDFDKCLNYIIELNEKGSVKYDPFKKNATNCSRFVFDGILAGATDEKIKKSLLAKSFPTSSPLGNCFYGTDQDTYLLTSKGIEIFKHTHTWTILKNLFNRPKSIPHSNTNIKIDNKYFFLDGVGDQSYFEITDESRINEGILKVSRITPNGERIYNKYFGLSNGNKITSDYKLVHDCNAKWITVFQEGQKTRAYAKS